MQAQYYKIDSYTLVREWIQKWPITLNEWLLHLIAHHYNQSQEFLCMGTTLGLLMFLVYINDIAGGVSSTLLLFANDCLLWACSDQNNVDYRLPLASHWKCTAKYSIYILPNWTPNNQICGRFCYTSGGPWVVVTLGLN